jgi:hypothetical protein
VLTTDGPLAFEVNLDRFVVERLPQAYPTEEVSMAKGRRTTHRSSSGKKLYAVRDAKGRFKDIQTYERAHRADLKRKSKKEK